MVVNDLDELNRVKDLVVFAHQFQEVNIKSYRTSNRFIFKKTLFEEDERNLQDLNLPILTANTLEPFLDRLCGEFSQNEPEMVVEYEATQDPNKVILEAFVDDALRKIMKEYKSYNYDNQSFSNMIAGGFCVLEWGYEYENPYTFKQKFYIKNMHNPAMCGYDPKATLPTRCDGDFVYKFFPLTPEEIKRQFNARTDDLISFRYPTQTTNFQWSYSVSNENKTRIIMVCELYQKKYKKFDLLLLENGEEISAADYKAKYGEIVMVTADDGDEDDEDQESEMEQTQEALEQLQKMQVKPRVVQKSRRSEVDYIERLVFIENKIFKRERTIYKNVFPLVWGDAKGYWDDGKWINRCYFYNAIDTQRLKNIIINQMVDEYTNIRKSDILMPEAALPKNVEYLRPYLNSNFRAGVMVYRHKSDTPLPSGLPDTVPPPQVFPKQQIPQDFVGFLDRTQQMQQNQLGAYDASIGINDNQLSGKALDTAIPQSNMAAKPLITKYMAMMNEVIKGIIEAIPKVYITPMTVPLIINKQRHYITFNTEDGIKIDYNVLQMKVDLKEGNSFENTKRGDLDKLIDMAKVVPAIGQMINSPQGLPLVLQNLDFKGSDQLRQIADEQAQNPPQPQPNPELMKAQAEMMKAQAEMIQKQIDQKKLALEAEKLEMEKQKAMYEAINKRQEAHQEEQRIHLEAYSDREAAALEKRRQDIDSHHKSSDRMTDYDKFHKDKMVDLTKTAASSIGSMQKGE